MTAYGSLIFKLELEEVAGLTLETWIDQFFCTVRCFGQIELNWAVEGLLEDFVLVDFEH